MTGKNKEIKIPLPGVGPQISKYLARLNIHSVEDLLLHLPLRYQDRTQITPIRALLISTEAVIEGIIEHVETPLRGRTKLLCVLRDDTGKINLRFFHVYPQQKNILKIGTRVRCFAEVRLGPQGKEMFHPEFKVIDAANVAMMDQHLTPIYPATEGLTQYTLRKLTTHALAELNAATFFSELLPAPLLTKHDLPDIKKALHDVHRPQRASNVEQLHASKSHAHRRLIFEELLAHRLSLLHLKKLFQTHKGIALTVHKNLISLLLQQLPFTLTKAQQRVLVEIQTDLQRAIPMLRLVQGDVGSGKTVVAAIAMLQAVENGYQAAFMAPTELLAEQHYKNIHAWFEPLGVNVALLTGSTKASERKKILTNIENGATPIVIGTHALFQKDVIFKKLVLIITDEQHRFGVEQRALLREKGMRENFYPHQLMMTATPIPRTLAMSLYADLDVSVIDELPPGRIPINTSVLASSKREEIITRLRNTFAEGRQAYWVCALIEESEKLQCQAAITTAQELQQRLPQFKVGLIHGKMLGHEKEKIMQDFKAGLIHLLVATTVIEVGVDVANATVMVIENAERLGLSQLHQLRGRVGRGAIASHCLLLYQHPLSELAKSRLAVLRETNDGFKIAEHDLQLRGPGEVLGTRQTGDLLFRVANLTRDVELLNVVQQAAHDIMSSYPNLIEPLITRWLSHKKEYGAV